MTADRRVFEGHADDRKPCPSLPTDSFDSGYEHSAEHLEAVRHLLEEEQHIVPPTQLYSLRAHA